MMFLPALDRQSDESLQKQIVRQMIEAISNGTLRSGEALSGVRDCASRWGVSRNTVVLALERLEAEGYLETRPSRGTYVHRTPPHVGTRSPNASSASELGETTRVMNPPRFLDRAFVGDNDGFPPLKPSASPLNLGFGSDVPLYRSMEWRRTVQRLLIRDNWKRGGQFQPNAGLPFLREAIARWVTARHGLSIDAQQVIVITGLQQAHSLVSRALLSPGMKVALEDPCYMGKRRLYETLGVTIVNAPVDGKGIRMAGLDLEDVSLVCVNPGCHVPTNVSLSLPRRRQLIALAGQTKTHVFEESMFDLLALEGKATPSLLTLSGGKNVLHAGLFAPALGGGVMLGYLIVPWALLPAVIDAKLIMDNGLPWLEQEALARFIDAGDLDNLLKRNRTIMMRRRDYLLSAMKENLGEIAVLGAGHAPRLSWFLPPEFPDTASYVSRVKERNVYIPGEYPLRPSAAPPMPELDRLVSHGYGEVSDDELEKVVQVFVQSANLS